MKLSRRTIVFIALVAAAGLASASAQTTQSRFLPNKTYDVVIKKTLGGNDGFQDIAPTTSTQRMHIVTGVAEGGGIPVELTVYRTQQRGEAASNDIDWQFRFTAANDGAIGDVSVTSSAEPTESSLAFAMLSRMLEQVLFNTDYNLRKANKDQIVVGRSAPRDGAASFVDVDYTIDRSATEAEESATSASLKTESRGTALFNTDLQFFTERSLSETSRIFVAQDALGDEKNVVMQKDLRIEVQVKDR